MKSLANAGHDVWVASPFPVKEEIENYHDVLVPNESAAPDLFESENWSATQMMGMLSDLGQFLANSTLNDPNMKNLIRSGKKFDAVIVEVFWVEALYGWFHLKIHLNNQIILFIFQFDVHIFN
jgi:glucuronosyltransferase